MRVLFVNTTKESTFSKWAVICTQCVRRYHPALGVNPQLYEVLQEWEGEHGDLVARGILSLFKEAWLSNKNSINKRLELPRGYSVLRAAIDKRWMIAVGREISVTCSIIFFHKTYRLFWRRIAVLIWKLNRPLTTKSPCSPSHSCNHSPRL